MGLKLTALIWGFAEGTFFFIAPDVLLTFIAPKDHRQATRACLWALGGALAGGALMFAWGSSERESAEHFLEHIPAISHELLQEVDRQVQAGGAMATFAGPVAGRPYKVYAVYAGASDVSFPMFLLISIPARLLRFLLAVWVTAAIFNSLLKKMQPRHKIFVLSSAWIVFYCWFFSVM
jgi:membrane protein YqaA with SNARE-associated domain